MEFEHISQSGAPGTESDAAGQGQWTSSVEAWEAHKAHIRALYLQQRRPLKEVMSVMLTEYSFKATVHMYKKWIRKWGLDKKNKEREILAMVRRKRARDAVGKETTFMLRGQQVNWEQIMRYLKRKGWSVDEALARARDAATPEALQCLPPTSVPSSPKTPRVLEIPEKVYFNICRYFQASFEAKTWYVADDGGLYSVMERRDSKRFLGQFENASFMAMNHRAKGWFTEARRLTSLTAFSLRQMVLEESPLTLHFLASLSRSPLRYQQPEAARRVFGELAGTAISLLPLAHPLRLICESLMAGLSSQPGFVFEKAIEVLAEMYSKHLGPFHVYALVLRLELLIHNDADKRQLESADSRLRSILLPCERAYGAEDQRCFEIYQALARSAFRQQRFEDAENLCLNSVARLHNGDMAKKWPALYNNYMGWLALTQYAQGKRLDAEASLKTAITFEIDNFEQAQGLVIYLLSMLKDLYVECKRPDDALAVNRRISKILDSLEERHSWEKQSQGQRNSGY